MPPELVDQSNEREATPSAGHHSVQARHDAYVSADLKVVAPQKCCEGGDCSTCGKDQPEIDISAEFGLMLEGLSEEGGVTALISNIMAAPDTLRGNVELVGQATSGDGQITITPNITKNADTLSESPSAHRYYESLAASAAPVTSIVSAITRVNTETSTRPLDPQLRAPAPSSSPKPQSHVVEPLTGAKVAADRVSSTATSATRQYVKSQSPKTLTEKAETKSTTPARDVAAERNAKGPRAASPAESIQTSRARMVSQVGATMTAPAQVARSESVRVALSSRAAAQQSVYEAQKVASRSTSKQESRSIPLTDDGRSMVASNGRHLPPARSAAPNVILRDRQNPRSGVQQSRGAADSPENIKRLSQTLKLHALLRQTIEAPRSKALQGMPTSVSSRLGATRSAVALEPRRIQQMLRLASQVGLRSTSQTRAISLLRSAAHVLSKSRDPMAVRIANKVALQASRTLRGAAQRQAIRLSTSLRSGRVVSMGSTRTFSYRARVALRVQVARMKLTRLKTNTTRGQQSRARIARQSPHSRLSGRTSVRQRSALRSRVARSTVVRVRSGQQRTERAVLGRRERSMTSQSRSARLAVARDAEVRALRRDVRNLRRAVDQLLPMLEMMHTAKSHKLALLGEEEFDVRSVSSERELRALLRKKKLSMLQANIIERKLAKLQRDGRAGAMPAPAPSASQKSKNGSPGSAKEKAKDAEQKTYDKTLSIFRMRTQDSGKRPLKKRMKRPLRKRTSARRYKVKRSSAMADW